MYSPTLIPTYCIISQPQNRRSQNIHNGLHHSADAEAGLPRLATEPAEQLREPLEQVLVRAVALRLPLARGLELRAQLRLVRVVVRLGLG